MRVFLAAAMIASLAGPAYAQDPVPRYGETAKPKSPQELATERNAEKAYKKSLSNIPNQGPVDPWGNVRSETPPKPVGKASSAKPSKAGIPAN
jgi:hypothetical protein